MADNQALAIPRVGFAAPAPPPATTFLKRLTSWWRAATLSLITILATVFIPNLGQLVTTFLTRLSWGDAAATLSLVTILATFFFPTLDLLHKHLVGRRVHRRWRWLAALVDPYMSVTINQYVDEVRPSNGFMGMPVRSEVLYEEAKAYLGDTCWRHARRLRAEAAKKAADEVLFSMLEGEEVPDEFEGATVWWTAKKSKPDDDKAEEAWYVLYHQEQHKELVRGTYLRKVRREGRAIITKDRQRSIFTNTTHHDGWAIHAKFEHHKTFDKLAMDPVKKQDVIDDLTAFKEGREYYAELGKPWKRGYLLYGPPGTGKSTMVAAMANFLDYDVYDLELTSVISNTELRRLLVGTKSKSIIVIEDIDCLLDIFRTRDTSAEAAPLAKLVLEEKKEKFFGVTLSGVLNFVDGLWSPCGEERIIVFTTNHLEDLDPALIRPGRMDKRIEMTYCCFEAFKFLAKMYLNVEWHHEFGAIEELLGEVKMTPAHVAEKLTRKTRDDGPDEYLKNLVNELKKIKMEAD